MTEITKIQELEWYATVPRSIRKHTIFGFFLIAVFFGGFGAWSLTAPLAAAVIAQGSFVATGQNKIVQHFEGGIIKELLVTEGDRVKEDQPLVRLDETASEAKERQLFLRQMRLEAMYARLSAEEADDDSIVFPPVIDDNVQDPEVEAMVASQVAIFNAGRTKLASDIRLFVHNNESLRFRIEGYRQLLSSHERQLVLLEEEYRDKKILFDKGLMRSSEIKAIQRAIAEADGNIGRVAAEISESETQIRRNEQQIRQTRNAYRQNALEQLQAVGSELDAVREQIREAANVRERATVHSPATGIVVKMNYHTPGGVIESGKSILEILPSDVPLIVEAQISRNDIDSVAIGQEATIRLTALNQRTTPVLYGEVFYVSADSLPSVAENPRKEVYLVRISLPATELARIRGFSPTPGMPAEVFVQTAERTFFDYLSKPIVDSMQRAFMEQ